MAGEIVHWNISGLKCKRSPNYNDKLDSISSILENVNSTFLLNIQETHISSDKDLPNILRLYDHIYSYVITSSSENDPYSGIILCIRKTETLVEKETVEKGRLIYAKIQNKANNKITNIFSIYCNSSNSEKQKK